MREFNPADWYWLADDGRIFASARMTIVDVNDEDYVAWAAGGGFPTIWPRDDEGEQTDAALQEVLRPYGLWVDLVAYARDARWRAEVGGMVWNGVPIATDDSSKVKIAGARIAAQANPGFETTWWDMDGEGIVVDAALIIQLSDAVLAHVDGTFTTFGQVRAAITAGTITTREEVDAAFALSGGEGNG